jgi:hypothetical protein
MLVIFVDLRVRVSHRCMGAVDERSLTDAIEWKRSERLRPRTGSVVGIRCAIEAEVF